jgi:uncharacterized membrane protein YesL
VQIQVCENHGPRGLEGATIGETIFACVYIGKLFQYFPLKNHSARKTEIYIAASLYSAVLSLLKFMASSGMVRPQ